MKCERCDATIAIGDEREHHGQTLCKDCLVDALSPVKVCDRWAVVWSSKKRPQCPSVCRKFEQSYHRQVMCRCSAAPTSRFSGCHG